MKKYILTIEGYAGEMTITYANGIIKELHNELEIAVEHLGWLLARLANEMRFKALLKTSPKLKIKEVPLEVTFEMFYAKYGYKEAKLKAEAAWKKLSPGDQMQAYIYIARYKAKIAHERVAMAYPASYLNQKRWND